MTNWKHNISFKAYDDLISHIYDAGLDINLWPLVMRELASILNAKSANLRFKNIKDPLLGFNISHELDPSWNDIYCQ